MADITAVILADHEWFREQFAKLDELQAATWSQSRGALEKVWRPLADRLDVHAYIERNLLSAVAEAGADDPVGKRSMRSVITTTSVTVCETPTRRWSAPANGGRQSVAPGEANDDHMAEEEREGLSDFRRHAPIGLREALGRQFSEFMAAHPTTRGLPIADRDPQTHVDNIGTESRRAAQRHVAR
jgi:hypothetical protein